MLAKGYDLRWLLVRLYHNKPIDWFVLLLSKIKKIVLYGVMIVASILLLLMCRNHDEMEGRGVCTFSSGQRYEGI